MGIKISNVFYTYNKKASNSTLALNDVSFEITDNDFVAIVGETGSGKSTLAQTFNALLIPDKGEVQVDDYLINYKNRKSKKLKGLRKHIGLVFQFPEYQLFEETVEKDVAFGPKNFGILSGGERRKVAIAGILAIDPDILVFDEPTVGFDPASAKDLMNMICDFHAQGKTIIVITHDMDLVRRYVNKVFMFEKGKLVFEGTPTELFLHVQNYDRLAIPQVTKLALKLKEKGMDIDVDNIRHSDDLIEEIKKWRAKNG